VKPPSRLYIPKMFLKGESAMSRNTYVRRRMRVVAGASGRGV